jgi:tetratricopeptide (TPR) repeat protein
MYYPFLSHETKRIVEGLVEDALNYYDFVQKLVEVAEDYPIDSNLALFAIDQSLEYPNTWMMMKERCKESVLTKPMIFWKLDTYDPLDKDQLDELKIAMEQAVSAKPDDWLLLNLYIGAGAMSPEPIRSVYFDLAKTLFERNQDLQRFMPFIYNVEGYNLRIQGDVEGAIRVWEKSFKIANEYDNILSAAGALVSKANTIKDIDVRKALELYDEVYSMLTNRLTEFDAIRMVALGTALCYEALGEYDIALSLLFKDFEVKSLTSDDVQTTPATIVSRIYCTLEMPEQALEWLRAKTELHRLEESMLHSSASRALILQGQLDDAARHLASAHNSATKSGDDQLMGDYLYTKGLYELAVGDLNNAETTLEQALKLVYPQFQIQVNLGLLALTRCEILKGLNASTFVSDNDYSGPWMKRLEKHAKEKGYPGIQMQHALLKASYQTQIDEHEMARQTLEDALAISDSPGVKTLRTKIGQKLEELDSIKHKQT